MPLPEPGLLSYPGSGLPDVGCSRGVVLPPWPSPLLPALVWSSHVDPSRLAECPWIPRLPPDIRLVLSPRPVPSGAGVTGSSGSRRARLALSLDPSRLVPMSLVSGCSYRVSLALVGAVWSSHVDPSRILLMSLGLPGTWAAAGNSSGPLSWTRPDSYIQKWWGTH